MLLLRNNKLPQLVCNVIYNLNQQAGPSELKKRTTLPLFPLPRKLLPLFIFMIRNVWYASVTPAHPCGSLVTSSPKLRLRALVSRKASSGMLYRASLIIMHLLSAGVCRTTGRKSESAASKSLQSATGYYTQSV